MLIVVKILISLLAIPQWWQCRKRHRDRSITSKEFVGNRKAVYQGRIIERKH
ncbi:MAG: hypothetical protein V7785_07165 [Bermanella sp.]